MPGNFLPEVILIITAAFLGGFTARTFKFPPILGYIISGVIFGIVGKNFFESYSSILSLSQLGVSLLLFTLGFEISLDVLFKMNRKVLLVGILQVFLISAVLCPALLVFGLSGKSAILLAILFSFSSTAVVVKILEEKGLLNDFPGNNIFVFLLIQDLFIVPIIFFLPLLYSKGVTTVSITGFVIGAFKPLVIFVSILLLSRLFLSRLLNFLFRYPSHELTILATIFTATISILLFSSVGLPQSIAAFLAGVLISEQGKNLAPLTEIRPFRDLFLVLFFVLTGMLLNFNFFLSNIVLIVLITITIVAVKFAVLYIILRFSSYSPSSSVFISSYMANVGEFAVVISQIALISAFITGSEYNLILSAFILSLVGIPFSVRIARSGAERLTGIGLLSKLMPAEADGLRAAPEQIFQNHVVICGHGRVGRETRSMLDLAAIPYIVIDFNRKVISDLISASKYAIYGDPTDAEILKASFIENAKVLVIAVPDTFSQKKIINTALSQNPKIVILCRSHIEGDRYDLINLGVNTIIVPELEAGLRIGAEVLDLFEIKGEDVESYIKRLRRQHLL